MAKQLAEADITTLPQQGQKTSSIWLMMVVEAHPLVAGQTFQHKETLQIRIAEEANLRNIKVKIVWSSQVTYFVRGYNFMLPQGTRFRWGGWYVLPAAAKAMTFWGSLWVPITLMKGNFAIPAAENGLAIFFAVPLKIAPV
jgi:hypothetical protein